MLHAFAPGTPSHNGNPTGEEPNYPARRGQDLLPDGERRPGSPERRDEEKERWLEERKTKVLNMLSKLQDNMPVQSKSSLSRSNFEDCEFITMSKRIFIQLLPKAVQHCPNIFDYSDLDFFPPLIPKRMLVFSKMQMQFQLFYEMLE